MPNSPENATIHSNIARLLEIRALTVQFGAPPDGNRNELARESIALAWRLFDELAGWAILHQLGHAMSQEMVDETQCLAAKLGMDLSAGSPDLERLGALFSADPSERQDPKLDKMLGLIDAFRRLKSRENSDNEIELISVRAYQRFLFELLRGQSPLTVGSHWRTLLRTEIDQLLEGESPDLMAASARYRKGRPAEFRDVRITIICLIHFLAVRDNLTLERVRENLAEHLNVGISTFSDWAKKLRKNPDIENRIKCAEIAAEIGETFLQRKPLEIPDWERFGTYNNRPRIELADSLYGLLSQIDFEELRLQLKHSRQTD